MLYLVASVAQAFQPVPGQPGEAALHILRDFSGQSLTAFGPPIKHEKSSRAGVLARHSTELMVREMHPWKNFS
jgi:hypothetical protein